MIELLSYLAGLPTALLTAALGVVMVFDSIPIVGILVPADLAVLAATAGRDPVGGLSLAGGVVFGCLVGWSLGFLVGWRFGPRLRDSRTGNWIGAARWAAAERVLTAGGIRILMAAPFLPFVNTLVPLAAGGLRVSYWRFLPAVAVGSILWTGLYTTLGLLGNAFRGVIGQDSIATGATALVGLLLGWLAVRGARRRLALPVSFSN